MRVHRRVDLDHALRELGLELALRRVARASAQQVVGVGREIEVSRIDEHQLELDAERQCGRRFERKFGHDGT
jgi:hypothetical protein